MPDVAIFWDYENCSPPSISSGLGFAIVNNVGRIARLFGPVTTFRAYLDVSVQSSKSVVLRSELQSSGVSMIDCPHNGKKDVVDKMILVDMLAFAVDHPSPATVILITGDRDYAYAISILKLRKYQVVLIVPSSLHTPACLESQASLVIDWSAAVLRSRADPANLTQPVRQPCFDLDATLVTKLLRELQESPDDPDAAPCSASRPRRVTPRDLLEPSRHSKNTRSFDSAQELALDPASPKKSATAGLPIPKTPSRSRHASVSTASTRARSTTVVTQCPPPVEPCTPAKHPPPSTEREASTWDVTDAADIVQPSSPILASLDTLELSFHDNCPPSPIIVRSPLEPTRSTYDAPRVSGEIYVPFFQMLASPFTQPTGLQSAPNQQSDAMFTSTSPTVGPTKMLTEAVAAVYSTPQMNNVGAPNLDEIEHWTGLCFENEGVCEQSIPHQSHQDEACCAANPEMSNYDSCVASRTAHSLSDGNVGTGGPTNKHVLPCTASFPGADEGDDPAQSGAPLCISNARDHVVPATSLGASLSTPSAPTEAHERDEHKLCQTITAFEPLIHLLLAAREQGVPRPSRSTIAMDLARSDDQVYKRAGASRFRDYTALAEKAGVIELGGKEANAWIALHPDWFGVDGSTTTQSVSDRISSPTASSLLTGPETPLIEGAAIFRTPTPDASPTSIPDGQDRAPRMPIPAPFQPLIDVLVHIRAEGIRQPRRSIVGQILNQAVYSRAGVSGFKEYIRRASEAQLVQLGGNGGHAWIGLYPELQC